MRPDMKEKLSDIAIIPLAFIGLALIVATAMALTATVGGIGMFFLTFNFGYLGIAFVSFMAAMITGCTMLWMQD